jgi:hypothetical protein
MGADISLFIERRDADGVWRALDAGNYGQPYRSYHVFNRLAGVRQSTVRERGDMSEPIAEPRGLPVDSPLFHELTEDDYGDYSHGWLLVSELVDLPGREDMKHLLEVLNPLGLLQPSDRLVFWFS